MEAGGPIVDKTPDFIKSIPVWKAMDTDALVAYAAAFLRDCSALQELSS